MFGVSSYIPLFAQGVLGGDAFDAGLMVLPMSFSWPIASIIGGRVILRSATTLPPSSAPCSSSSVRRSCCLIDQDSSVLVPATAAFVIGFGMGFTTSAMIISVQNAVEWRFRGVATATTQFFRTIGGAISVAIMGAILNSQLSTRFAAVSGVPEGATEASLLNVEERREPARRSALRHAGGAGGIAPRDSTSSSSPLPSPCSASSCSSRAAARRTSP